MDWLDLLAIQGTLKSLLQHHSLKASCMLGGSVLKASAPRLAGTLSLPPLNTKAKRVPHSDPTICVSLGIPNVSLHFGVVSGVSHVMGNAGLRDLGVPGRLLLD